MSIAELEYFDLGGIFDLIAEYIEENKNRGSEEQEQIATQSDIDSILG